MPPSLFELHTSKRGKASDKWEAYFTAYEHLFAPLRHTSLSLLEIGVQNGGSLDVWASYFAYARHVIGVDIDPRCDALWYEDPRVNVVVGDANEAQTRASILTYCTEFDIVIDDGSHLSQDIVASFLAYFPVTKPGGLYVVEDTHALYRPVPDGGMLAQTSAMEFFKRCAELPNVEHWSGEVSPQSLFAAFLPPDEPSPAWLSDGLIESIEFRTSMIIVRKAMKPVRLGRRLVCGDEADVFPAVLRHQRQG
jgi:hypothetical protein